MPRFTAITRSGVSLDIVSGAPEVRLNGSVVWTLPAEAGFGIDPWIADVPGGVRAVCIGVSNDLVYLMELVHGTATIEAVSPGKARSSWVDEAGVVSWVPESDPYAVHYLGSDATTPSLDTKHPAWPVPGVQVVWGPVTVVDVHRSGDWECGTEAFASDRRVMARYQGGPPLEAWRGSAPKPARIQAHDGGRATVCIQIPEPVLLPDGSLDDSPVFVPSSGFRPYAPDPITVPTFVTVPQRCAVLVDGAPGVPWFADTSPQWMHEELGVLHTIGHGSLEQSVNLAASTNRVLYFYADHGRPTREMFAGLPDDGALPMVQCYPEKGETDAAFDARLRTSFNVVAARAFAVYACGYLALDSPEGTRTEQQVLNSLGLVNRAAAQYPTCRIVVVFTHERGLHDGVSRFPSIQEAVSRFQAAVPKWDDYPTVAELQLKPPTGPVDPPVEPPPIQPPTEPPVQPPVVHPKPSFTVGALLMASQQLASFTFKAHQLHPCTKPEFSGLYRYVLSEGPNKGKNFSVVDGGVFRNPDGSLMATDWEGPSEAFSWDKERGVATNIRENDESSSFLVVSVARG